MTNSRNLQKNKNGYYYLRMQRDNTDRKISLKTKNLAEAQLAAAIMRATISCMKIDTKKIKHWALESDGQNIKITTEDNDADRASALEAVKIIASKQQGHDSYQSVIQSRNTITMGEALAEYYPHLDKSTVAEKTKRMTKSTLSVLSQKLGANFNIGANDLEDEIEDKWLNVRLEQVARATVKRELSSVRGFIEFCADRKRNYAKAPLTLSIDADNEHYDYFLSADLKAIFDEVPNLHSSRFWLIVLGLYTGARISQICSIELSFFEYTNNIHILNFKTINKNKASLRKIPLHSDLIEMGLLEFIERQKERGRTKLISLTGKKASKFFTEFKRKVGINNDKKVFHSFRATAVDCLKQNGAGFDERCEYVGHSSGGGVHNAVYARNSFSVEHMNEKCVKLMNWQKYCGWQPDLALLKNRAKSL